MKARNSVVSARIPLARLVVGILLHFCVPAYLLACLVSAIALEPPVASAAAVLPRMLWTGAWFGPVFLLVTAVSAAVAWLIDSRLPTPLLDDAAVARAEIVAAKQVLARIGDPRFDRLVARLGANAWSFHELADQRVVSDLMAAARTFETAVASAAPNRRAEVLAFAADSLEALTGAAEQLAAERARLDEGDARTIAGYIDARYGK